MTGLLLEGIVASGKTSILRELQNHGPWQRRGSKLVLSEYFTERANEHLRSRTAETYHGLMQKNVRLLEAAHQIEVASPLLTTGGGHDLCFVIERFHLTNAISYAGGTFDAYRDVDQELARLGCRLALLVIDEMMVGPRIAEVYRQRGPRWQAYQDRLEAQVGDLSRHYAEAQAQYRRGAEWSALEHVIIDTTDKDWPRCVREISQFWRI